MIDGDVNEFVDKLHYGVDLYIRYKNELYFFQGWDKDGVHTFCVTLEKPPYYKYIFRLSNKSRMECVNSFLKAKIWGGKTFYDVEKEMTWVDC